MTSVEQVVASVRELLNSMPGETMAERVVQLVGTTLTASKLPRGLALEVLASTVSRMDEGKPVVISVEQPDGSMTVHTPAGTVVVPAALVPKCPDDAVVH